MQKKLITLIYSSILLIAAFILITATSLYLWLLSGTRNIGFTKELINNYLLEHEIKMSFEESQIFLNKKNHNIELTLKKFKIINTLDESIIAETNDITTSIWIPKFISSGKIQLSTKIKDASFFIKNNNSSNSKINYEDFKQIINCLYFSYIDVKNLKLELNGKKWLIINEMLAQRNKKSISGKIALDLFDGYFNFNATIDKNNIAKFSAITPEITTQQITKLIHNQDIQEKIKKHLNISLSANTEILFNLKNNEFDKVSFNINTESENSPKFNLSATANNDFENFELHNLNIKLNENSEILAYGTRIIENNDAKWNLSVNVNQIESNIVENLWPKNMLPDIREWSVERVTNALIEKGEGHLVIFENDPTNNQVNFNLEVKNANLKYLDHLPEIKNIEANLKFSEDQLEINAESANSANSDISFANIIIPYSENSKLEINVNSTGPNSDVLLFIPKTLIDDYNEKYDLQKIQGKHLAFTKISFPMKENLTFADVKMDIKVETKGISIPKLIRQHSNNQSNIHLQYKKNKFNISSRSIIYNKKFALNWLIDMSQNYQQNIELSGNLDKQDFNFYNLNRITGNNIEISRGIVSFNSNISVNQQDMLFDFNADLLNAQVSGKIIACDKQISQDLDLTGKGKIEKDLIKLEYLKLTGKNIDVRMSGDFTNNSTNFVINRFICPNNDFSLTYSNDNDVKIDVYGSKMSLIGGFTNPHDKDLSKNIIGKIKIDELFLQNSIKVHNFSAKFKCNDTSSFCQEIDIIIPNNANEVTEFKSFQNDLHNIEIKSDNISTLFQGFNIYDKIISGDLKGNLTSQISENNHHFKGNLLLKKVKVKKDSILSHLISLTSLKGLASLGMKNHEFRKIEMDIEIKDKQIFIKEGIAKGSDFNLTISGKIDIKNKNMRITGSLIPSVYGVNSILSKIPLVGEIFGGKNGGVIGFRYKIKGDFDNVKASVNPLSAIAPGVLRKIFE